MSCFIYLPSARCRANGTYRITPRLPRILSMTEAAVKAHFLGAGLPGRRRCLAVQALRRLPHSVGCNASGQIRHACRPARGCLLVNDHAVLCWHYTIVPDCFLTRTILLVLVPTAGVAEGPMEADRYEPSPKPCLDLLDHTRGLRCCASPACPPGHMVVT